MNEKQRLFFKALKDIKDENVDLSVWSLEPNAKIQSTEHLKKEYMSLQKKLNTVEDREAFEKYKTILLKM